MQKSTKKKKKVQKNSNKVKSSDMRGKIYFLTAITLGLMSGFIVIQFWLNTTLYLPSLHISNNNHIEDIKIAQAQMQQNQHVKAPKIVKGIYMTAYTASGGKRFTQLVNLIEQTELNAVVIDIKNQKGSIAFDPQTDSLKPYVIKGLIPLKNMDETLEVLKEKNIYRIARLQTFLDPFFAERHPEYAVKHKNGNLWQDYRGMKWLDPASKDVWKYNVDLAKEAYERGFDEIQFDYIRFPSDGPISSIRYPFHDPNRPKDDAMEDFFKYLHKELREQGIVTSIDLFGLTFWMTDFDLNIGQRLEKTIPYFDYISPMVYPSHYPNGYFGFANPAKHPYEIIHRNMLKGKEIYDKMDAEFTARPWIQDFDLGAVYDAYLVKQQFKAIDDANGAGWILWNPRNVYTEDALKRE